MPRRAEPDPSLPVLTLMPEATAAGLTPDQVRQRLRSGAWSHVARGAYLPDGEHQFVDVGVHTRARIDHIYRAVAAASRNPGTTVCDASAALMNGLSVLDPPARVQLAVPPGTWSGTRSGIDFRIRAFTATDVVQGRVPFASPLRCWVDITRLGTLADSLVCGDSAVRRGKLDPAEVAALVDGWAGQRGCRRLHRAAPLLDGERETALESASIAYFVEHGIPIPACQVTIRARSGSFLGRVDFLWEFALLVGESDGRLKYVDADALYAEKRREDAIRSEGYGFVRWGMGDLRSRVLADRLHRLLR